MTRPKSNGAKKPMSAKSLESRRKNAAKARAALAEKVRIKGHGLSNANAWKPGQSGNPLGRLKLALSNELIRGLNEHFTTGWNNSGTKGQDAIDRVWRDKPEVYLAIIAKCMPAEPRLGDRLGDESMTPSQIRAEMTKILTDMGYEQTTQAEVIEKVVSSQ